MIQITVLPNMYYLKYLSCCDTQISVLPDMPNIEKIFFIDTLITILPEMNKQWPMAENNLLEMGKQSEELESIVKNFVLEPLKRGIIMNKDNNQVDINLSMIETFSLPKIIWLNLFLYIFHKMGIHMISHKNLSYFVESFSRNYEKKYRFMFSNGCIGFFMKNNLRIIRVNK